MDAVGSLFKVARAGVAADPVLLHGGIYTVDDERRRAEAAAVRDGLDAMEAARRHNGPSDNRHHSAHLQLIHVDDIERFRDLHTTANFPGLWAWLMRQAHRVGSIEVGKRADVVVLGRKLFGVPLTEISESRVFVTLLNGEIVWSARRRTAGSTAVDGEIDSR